MGSIYFHCPHTKQQSWDSNQGPLGEKRERYLCAEQTPLRQSFLICSKSIGAYQTRNDCRRSSPTCQIFHRSWSDDAGENQFVWLMSPKTADASRDLFSSRLSLCCRRCSRCCCCWCCWSCRCRCCCCCCWSCCCCSCCCCCWWRGCCTEMVMIFTMEMEVQKDKEWQVLSYFL